MTLSNVFDISPQNPLDEYGLGISAGSVNTPFGYPAVNQYATLNNNTTLAPLRHDTFGAKPYTGDAPGTHKDINWKTVGMGLAGVFVGILGLKYGAGKIISPVKKAVSNIFSKLNPFNWFKRKA